MFDFFANLFGYILNFLYSFIQNYGLAIILFSIVIKLLLLPISVKQQKTLKKSTKLQAEMKEIQNKYKGNQEKINQEVMDLYKREKMSPFSGCLSGILQIILLLSIFYLVRSPLTFMKKVDPQIIENYKNEIIESRPEENKNLPYPEIAIIQEKGQEDEIVNINMEFLGLDLSKVPTQDWQNPIVYIIPILYVISSFVSIRITSSINNKKKKEEENKATDEVDTMAQANKTMAWMMPIMSISIAVIAPLGLALYWLVNNILMIAERVIINKFMDSKGDE